MEIAMEKTESALDAKQMKTDQSDTVVNLEEAPLHVGHVTYTHYRLTHVHLIFERLQFFRSDKETGCLRV
jgi:hypothetical protein